ncbi:reverse transcriptase domain-containing protein [Tanacetum coccineum]
MTTLNQGMIVEEIERVVAQRVANAIEAIAIYETKTNMSRKSMSQTKRQKDKVTKNASNKRKREGNHNGSSSQQNKVHKVPRAHTTRPINKKANVGSLPLGMTSKPKTMQDAIEFATELMNKKISNTLTKCQAENKRKLDNNNQAQQQSPKKQCVTIAYTAGSGDRKEYAGTLPLCNKCKFHHNGQCTVKCANYKRVSHLTQDCRSPAATNNQRNLTCYECGNQGHYKSDFSKLKGRNHENQAGGTGAWGMMHALGGGETNQDLNDMEHDINA